MKKRLAFVTNPLDSGFRSSISIVTLELARRLREDYDVSVYTSFGKDERTAPEGIGVRRLPAGPDSTLRRFTGKLTPLYSLKRPFFSSPLYYPWYMTRLAWDLRISGADIVHIHNFTQFLPVIKRIVPGIRIVLHMHSEWLSQLDRGLMSERVRHADLVLSCSEFITGKTRAAFPEAAPRCRTLYNGVDVSRFGKAPQKQGGNTIKRRTLICVGRITPEKGLHIVIEAFNRLADRYPDLELSLIGQERITPAEFLIELSDDPRLKPLKAFYPGSYRKRILEGLAPSLSSRVSLSGHVSHSEMASIYTEATVFLNASYYESFGIPVAEAMACGVPVVATRAGGVPEIVEDGVSGLLVEPGDAQALVGAITALLEDAGLRERLASAARERIRERFNWDSIAARLADFYREMDSH